MRNQNVQEIFSNLDPTKLLAVICSNTFNPRSNLTSEDKILQAAYINLGRAKKIHPHSHFQITRTTVGTLEAWIVLKGKAIASFYDTNNQFINSVEIKKRQIIILFEGGHALEAKSRKFSMIELKNGPYIGKKFDTVQIN